MRRTSEEMKEAFSRVGNLLSDPDYEDDETLQAIYETLRWCDGDSNFEETIGMHLPQ